MVLFLINLYIMFMSTQPVNEKSDLCNWCQSLVWIIQMDREKIKWEIFLFISDSAEVYTKLYYYQIYYQSSV